MKTIIYLIQVSACTGIFYLFYHAVLSKLTFFTTNRWYLLATLMISFIIPAITLPGDTIPQDYRVSTISFSAVAEKYIPDGSANTITVDEPFDWLSLLPVIYFSVAAILAVYFFISLVVLLKKISKNRSAGSEGIRLLKTDKAYKNGSFFNCIFINDEKLSPDELEQVIAHELVHVEHKHSVDKIIARTAQVILWFNPFAYAYYTAIEANHEYEVDRKVSLNSGKEAYAELILRLVASGNGSLYHHFSKFPLSKRITLLFSKPTKNMKKLFYLAILPLLVISCVFFAKCESAQPKADKAGRKISSILAEAGLGEDPLVFIDGKEYKPEKLDEIGRKEIGKTTKVIIRKGTENNVRGVIEISTKNGKIDQINISPARNKISSILDGTNGLGKDPLVIIDGKEYDSEILFHISSENIIAKKIAADGVKKYGLKAKDGIVELTTSNKKILYMTAVEKENLLVERKVPKNKFYSRITLKKPDGSFYDKIIIEGGKTTCTLEHNSKAVYVIDGKIYEEEQVNKFDQAKINSLDRGESGVRSTNLISIPGMDLKKYEVLFYYNGAPKGMKDLKTGT